MTQCLTCWKEKEHYIIGVWPSGLLKGHAKLSVNLSYPAIGGVDCCWFVQMGISLCLPLLSVCVPSLTLQSDGRPTSVHVKGSQLLISFRKISNVFWIVSHPKRVASGNTTRLEWVYKHTDNSASLYSWHCHNYVIRCLWPGRLTVCASRLSVWSVTITQCSAELCVCL